MNTTPKNILWITNIPSPYRVDFFNEFGKYCNLTVLFDRPYSSERDDSWKSFVSESFTAVFLSGKYFGVDGAFCPSVLNYIKRNRFDYIVVTNFYDPTGILAILALRIKRIPYVIETDGGFAGSGKGIKEKLKKLLLGGATLYFSTSKDHDQYYKTYGAEEAQLVRSPFSSLRDIDLQRAYEMSSHSKYYKEKLGMMENKIVLSVGRFSYDAGYGKGYDILMKVAEELGSEYGIYIVGDEPTEEFIEIKKRNHLNQVHFIGFKIRDELAEYYAAADCFAFLSRKEAWGLVINEAMAYGLPIISSRNCVAAAELVKNGENGYLIELDDIPAIAGCVKTICNDSDTIEQMKRNNRVTISNYTVEHMAKVHAAVFETGGVA